jgi:monoglucosyldiacylglycerol epimerase
MLIVMDVTLEQVSGTLLKSAALFVVATFVFDAIHFSLHVCLKSRFRWLRSLASPHEAHHAFFDRRLRYHEEVTVPNLVHHVIPEYATQMVVCALALIVLGPLPVVIVASIFTALFASAMTLQGRDHNHIPFSIIPVARETLIVRAPYHAMHHVYPDSYLSSYTTLFDGLMGTACQVRGRRVALTGASGSFGTAMKDLLEHAGASVIPLRFGVDWAYEDYSGADAVLESADILVLAHGARGKQAMQANCDSFLALIDRFKSLTPNRQIPVEVWAVGSEIECHPTFGVESLQSYAHSKRAFARAAATLILDRDILYRHIVPSAFRSRMGPGLMTGRTAAAIALWLIRRGFRYVPVTYTGVAFLNLMPFVLRGLRAQANGSRIQRFSRSSSSARRWPRLPTNSAAGLTGTVQTARRRA